MRPHNVICRILLLLLLFGAMSDCGGAETPPINAEQRVAASVVGQAANDALPLLVEHYKQQGLAIVERAGTEQEAQVELASLDDRWEVVWRAHHALELSQHGWADAIEGGLDTAAALRALEAAWCVLQGVWPADLEPIPLQLGGCAEGSP